MNHSLTELQLALMNILWRRGETTVMELHEELRRERRIAQSTVATLLSRMEKRDLVAHRQEGRQYLYRAAVAESEVRHSVVAKVSGLMGRLFGGDVAAMVSHLIRENEVEPDELARVREMLARREAELREGEA